MAGGYDLSKDHMVGPVALNERQAKFIQALADGAEIHDAKTSAGYPVTTPLASVLQSPDVRRAIDASLQRALRYDHAPVALSFLGQVMRDPKFSDRVRVDAAKTILDRAGYTSKTDPKGAPGAKDPHEMDTPELHALVSDMERELAGRAKPIETASAPLEDQLSDLID